MIDKYLERIKYSGSLEPTYDTLYKLHTGHVFNIPFENLDVYAGKPILLDEESLFDKLVTRKRGGYCFEMNGLFAIVLAKLGFKVKSLLARGVFNGIYMGKLHQVLSVELDGKLYLADVGYGNDGIAAPLEIVPDVEQTRFVDTFKFTPVKDFGYLLERKSGDAFAPMYSFTLSEYVQLDFEIASHYTSTHPQSFFKMMQFITMPTETGRITLTDKHLKITENGSVTEREINSDFNEYLKKQFGLEV